MTTEKTLIATPYSPRYLQHNASFRRLREYLDFTPLFLSSSANAGARNTCYISNNGVKYFAMDINVLLGYKAI